MTVTQAYRMLFLDTKWMYFIVKIIVQQFMN